MKTIFYLIGVIAILYKVTVLVETKKYINAKKALEKNKGKIDNLSQNLKNFIFLQYGYFIWVIVGMFSSNWILFLLIFLLSFILKGNYILIIKLDAILTLGILILILLNKFQLNIHWLNYLQSYL